MCPMWFLGSYVRLPVCIIGSLGCFVVSSVFCVVARGFLVRTKTLVTFKRYLSHVVLSRQV